jgi:NAD(P)-dependent dehydrogenase (short-subunit alcohol dehydrogenase family)
MPKSSTPYPLAVLTGAAGGLGSATCEILLKNQWAVLGLDHNTTRLQALAEKFENLPFYPLFIELEDPRLADHVEQNLPNGHPVRAFVHVAAQSIGDDILHISRDDWEKSLSTNLTSAMVLAQRLAPKMIEAGTGAIVNVGSPVGIVGARKPSYAASKSALHGLTMSLARNLGPQNIRANLLLPGPMITPMTQDWSAEKRERIASASFLKRLCDPKEVAAVIHFLLSPAASYITGSVIDTTAGSMYGH